MSGRIFVGGVGNPWLGDLDFGPRWVRRYADVGWPEHVVVADAAVAAHRVLHMLQEVSPDRVIFVAAFPRGDLPGTIRRYRPEDLRLDPDDVQARLGEAAGGVIDLEHTLAVTRYYGALPEDTVVIEVEAVHRTFGTTVSPEVESSFELVLEMVRREISRPLEAHA